MLILQTVQLGGKDQPVPPMHHIRHTIMQRKAHSGPPERTGDSQSGHYQHTPNVQSIPRHKSGHTTTRRSSGRRQAAMLG